MLSWDINWLAVVVAVIAYQVIGFLWYGPLFGKKWRAAMGVSEDDIQNPGAALAVGLVSSIVMAVALALLLTLGVDPDIELGCTLGAIAGLVVVAALVMHAAYENKNQTVLWIGAAYQLVGLIVMGAILGGMQ